MIQAGSLLRILPSDYTSWNWQGHTLGVHSAHPTNSNNTLRVLCFISERPNIGITELFIGPRHHVVEEL